MKRTRLLAFAITMAMLVLTIAAPLSVAEELIIPNELDTIDLTGADGIVLDDIDLSGVSIGALGDLDSGDIPVGPVGAVETTPQTPDVYVVSFDACGGSPVPEAQQIAAGGTVAKPVDPALAGYAFAGWYWNGVDFFAGDPVAVYEDINLVAAWEPVEQKQDGTDQPGDDPDDVEVAFQPEDEQDQAEQTEQQAPQSGTEADEVQVSLDAGADGIDANILPDLPVDGSAADMDGLSLFENESLEDYENSGASNWDNDALFEGYVMRALSGLRSNDETHSGRDTLTDPSLSGTLKLYDAMKVKMRQVAAGEITHTEFTFSDAELGIQDHWWTKEDFGLPYMPTDKELQDALKEAEGIDTSKLINALSFDMPYDLYWFDKNAGSRYKYEIDRERAGGEVVRVRITSVTCSLYVSDDYSRSKQPSTFEMGDMPSRVKKAGKNIDGIVRENSGKDDYDKLYGYLSAICELAGFNKEMMDTPDSGDVKQLIWVFDGDPNTKVVCQGYAKAFKYLCDRTSFAGDVECEMMSGWRSSKTEIGTHMWDVVKMSDGRYYLVDPTHCDTETEKKGTQDESTFMKGVSGNPGGPYGIGVLKYESIDYDVIKTFGENSPWFNYSHEDYGKNYEMTVVAKRGAVSFSPKAANPGDTVTLKLQPANYCEYGVPVVKRGSTELAVTKQDESTYTFMMPMGVVMVEVNFPSTIENLYAIVLPETVIGGTMTVSVGGESTTATIAGTTVTVACTADLGYTVAAPSVSCASGPIQLVDIGGGVWTFVMPGDDVIVEPFFKAEDSWGDLQEEIENAKNGSVIKLTKDVIATNRDYGLVIPENKNITLDLNGHAIDRNLSEPKLDGAAIKVIGRLTIQDSSPAQTGVIKNAYNTISGGGIYVTGDSASLTLNSGRITNCKTPADGGGVCVFLGSFTMNGGIIENCSSGNNGGGILADRATLVLNGGTVKGNVARRSGGAVYSYLASMVVTGGTFEGNAATDEYGGGLYWRSYSDITKEAATGDAATLVISGNPVIKGNTAVDGAGMWAVGKKIELSGGTFKKNACNGGNGGGIYALADDGLTIAGVTVSGNKAKSGAGLYSESPKTTITGGTFKENKSTEYGGGIYVDGNKLEIKKGTVSSNSAKSGGGVYAKVKTATISGITLKSNTAKEEGGGVYVKGTTFKLTGGEISGNKAKRGGGVYSTADTTEISGKVTVKKNNGTAAGGGVFVKSNKFNLKGGTFSENKAPNGGGVYTAASTTNVTGGTIKGNTASTCGGGLYAVGKKVTIKKVTIASNSSTSYGGGLFVVGGSAVTMTGGEIKSNTSKAGGAGVYVNKGSFTMSGGKITGNTSKKYNGGLGLGGSGKLTVSGSAYIFGNKGVTDGKSVADDVNIGQKLIINVNGKLNSKAKIGVRGGPHVFTKGLGSEDNAKAFVCNDSDRYKVEYNSSKKEAEIVKN